MDLKQIKNLVQLVEDAKISHLCVEQDGLKIEVKKEAQAVQVQVPAHAPSVIPTPAALSVSPNQNQTASFELQLTEIKAEMVGTFYASPNPESEPFVRVGSRIKPGDIIYVIEAMKLFNEVESEWNGTIQEICVKNGESVEFGQTLFKISQD